MPITNFLGFSTTASSNVDVNGISIQGTSPVSNFDNSFRELMAILRRDLDNGMVFTSKSAGYTAVANDNNAFIRFSAAATLSLTAAATLGADWHCWVMADGGAVVIDPNSTETINGATTITIPDGATVLVICDGSNFRATEDYTRFVQPTVDVASATTTDIGAAASWNVRITGTTTITGLGTVAEGTLRFVRMEGALTLTHNGTSLILPNGGNNITTAANDCFLAKSLGSGNWLVMFYQKASTATINQIGSVATTTGTTVEFNAIPASVRRVTVVLNAVSLSSTSSIIVQLGTASSFETTSYISSAAVARDTSATVGTNSAAGFIVAMGASSTVRVYITMTLTRISGNDWVCSYTGGISDGATLVSQSTSGGGSKSLSGELTRLRLNSVSGTDTYDFGSANVFYEF